jgi:hypothetical protein
MPERNVEAIVDLARALAAIPQLSWRSISCTQSRNSKRDKAG